jgi:hypothetical protein
MVREHGPPPLVTQHDAGAPGRAYLVRGPGGRAPRRPPPHAHTTAIAVPTRAAASYPFEIRKSSIQGRGAFATRQIRKGQRLIEYTGDRITPEEGDRRYIEDGMKRHHTFLFTVDEKTCIDGKRGGNESRYINHSCDPNCEAVIEDGRIFLFAKRGMAAGTELTYDYQYERTPEHTKEDEEFYRCLCGTDACRGTILAPPKRTRAKKGAAKKAGAKKGAAKKGGAEKAGARKTGAAKRATAKRGAKKAGARQTRARA